MGNNVRPNVEAAGDSPPAAQEAPSTTSRPTERVVDQIYRDYDNFTRQLESERQDLRLSAVGSAQQCGFAPGSNATELNELYRRLGLIDGNPLPGVDLHDGGDRQQRRQRGESPATTPGAPGNEVRYPDGNVRTFGRDQSGAVNDIVTRDKNGHTLSHYIKDGDKWYYETPEGMRAQLQGNIQVSPRGDVSFETSPGTWRTERTDGSTQWERTNADGSRVALTPQGKPQRITRKDGSSVEAEYGRNGQLEKVTETDAHGHAVTWQRNGDHFDSQSPGREQRKNIELSSNGSYSYQSFDGFKYTVTGDGTKICDDLGLTTKRDAQGRVEQITYPGGKKTRTLGRDEHGNVNSITTRDEKGERTYIKDGNNWYLQLDGMNLKLPGNIQVSAKGDVSFEVRPGVWQTERTNGQVVRENALENGARVSLNQQGRVERITRADGSIVEAQYDRQGQPSQIAEYNADGSNKRTWVKNGDHWESYPPGKPNRKDIELMPSGITQVTNADGTKTITMGDGKQLTETPGHARFSFDRQGRFESITYPNGETLKFGYDDHGLKQITKIKDGKVVHDDIRIGDHRWEVRNGNGRVLGRVDADYKINANGEVRWKNLDPKKNPEGFENVINTNGESHQEKLNADGSRVRRNPDKTTVEIDKDGLIRKVQTSKDDYRTFEYDERGKLSRVTDHHKGKEPTSWNVADHPERSNIQVRPNGDVTYRLRDGGAVIERATGAKIELDKDGYMTRVTQPNGNTREFSYDTANGQRVVTGITDTRHSGQREIKETWTRQKNADGSYTDTFVSGTGENSRQRRDVVVGRDGDYQYKTSDGKLHISRAGADRSNENGFSASVEEARERLLEQMDAHMDEAHRQRFRQILDRFERRAHDRVEAQTAGGMNREQAQQEWDQKVARTYDHLSHMLTQNAQGAPYDLNTRVKLVEDAAFAMAVPPKANDQGNWGCCWMISGVYLGVIQHPDKMAKMLDELSTSGKFTDTQGHTWTPPAQLLRFTGQGGSWTIDNCGDSRRNPVSEIWVSVAAYLSADGRRMDRGANGGDMGSCMHAMQLITGDRWRGTTQSQMTNPQYKQDLLLKGGVILFSPGHMYLGTLDKVNGQWQIISSVQHGDHGRVVNGVVTDLQSWNVQRTRQQYRPDINLPKLNDQPVGPGGGGNGPYRPRYSRNYYPQYQPQYQPEYQPDQPPSGVQPEYVPEYQSEPQPYQPGFHPHFRPLRWIRRWR